MRGLVGQVVQKVGRDVVSGRLAAGLVLPKEAVWAADLGVSRTVLREAVKVLISKGMIESRPRTGTRVRDFRHWNALDPNVIEWRMHSAPRMAFVTELFELRRIIEPGIAARAAATATDASVAAMAEAYAEMVATSGDPELFLIPDAAFHRAILHAVGNVMVRSLGDAIDAALTVSLGLTVDTPGGHRPSLPLHAAVLDAIRRRDSAGARDAMTQLIDDAQKDALAALAEKNRGKPET